MFDGFLKNISSGVIFYVDLREKIYVKSTYTILCSFKDPTWISHGSDFIYYINFLF
jgi:hypothetical protein